MGGSWPITYAEISLNLINHTIGQSKLEVNSWMLPVFQSYNSLLRLCGNKKLQCPNWRSNKPSKKKTKQMWKQFIKKIKKTSPWEQQNHITWTENLELHFYNFVNTEEKKKPQKIKGVITPDSQHKKTTHAHQQHRGDNESIYKHALTQKSHFGQAVFLCRVHIWKGGSYFLSYFLYFFLLLKEMFCRGESRRLDFINLRL